jgi:uncharacterized protein (DUF2141 family)
MVREILFKTPFMTTIAAIVVGLGVCATRAQTPEGVGGLIVTIDGLRGAKGHVRVAVFNRESGFPDDELKAYRTTVARIEAAGLQVRFNELPFGTYAVSMYHDENDDAKFNKMSVRSSQGGVRRVEQHRAQDTHPRIS